MRIETKRQLFHFVLGTVFAALAAIFSQPVFLIVCAALLLVQAVIVAFRNPVGTFILTHFERPNSKRPGKGAFAMTVGVLLTALLFPAHIVVATLVLAWADSASTLVGRHGKHKLPWSPKKTWEGLYAFYLVSAVILAFATSFWWLGALVVTALESIDYSSIAVLDDNLILPLATGALLMLI